MRRFLKPIRSFLAYHRERRDTASRLKSVGRLRITEYDASLGILTPEQAANAGGVVHHAKNLETSFVLEAIAKALIGETGKVGDVSIEALSMAIGNGTTPVTATDTAIPSELMRKDFSASGSSRTRAGGKVTYSVTLLPGEVLGAIGVLGLFGIDTGSGTTATGTITFSGTPSAGNSVSLTMDTTSIPPYFVTTGQAAADVAASYAAWLNLDGYFSPLYTATCTGVTVSIVSNGKGTVYNKALTVTTTGAVSATAVGVVGGTTPGGQLIAAANVSFTKAAGSNVLVEWTINITN